MVAWYRSDLESTYGSYDFLTESEKKNCAMS